MIIAIFSHQRGNREVLALIRGRSLLAEAKILDAGGFSQFRGVKGLDIPSPNNFFRLCWFAFTPIRVGSSPGNPHFY